MERIKGEPVRHRSAIREQTDGRSAGVVLDFVGAAATLAMGAAATRQQGDLTIVGLAGGTLPVSFLGLPYEVSVQTTYWGSRPEFVEALDLAARGLVRPRVTTFPLSAAIDAYHLLADLPAFVRHPQLANWLNT